MFNRIDASKSTKGASKLRRDLINAEIANLRDLLPLPPSTRQRLSQLQLMALVCVFLRKANYFQQALKSSPADSSNIPTPNIGFSKAMSGFIMMMTQQGKLLYISENAAEYLGHSMEDLLIHGDSVYDVIDKQDHMTVQNQLARNSPTTDDKRLFLCRINVSRNSRRQIRFGDQKVVLVEGHYLPFVPLCNRNESVFLASCTPVVLPETRESVVQGATNIFTTIHSMDMKYLHIDKTDMSGHKRHKLLKLNFVSELGGFTYCGNYFLNPTFLPVEKERQGRPVNFSYPAEKDFFYCAESHMEYSRSELVGVSWYNLLHWDCIRTAYCKHQTVIQSDQERSSTALLRLQNRSGRWFWVHCVLQVKDTSEECQHPIIVCTNQVLSEKEAEVLRASNWLYQYSSQSKFTYGVCPPVQSQSIPYNHNHDYARSNLLPESDSSPSYVIEESWKDRPVKTEGEYTMPNCGRLTHEEAEPVDMSINSSSEHENRPLHSLAHSLNFSPKHHKGQKCLSHPGCRTKILQIPGQFLTGDSNKYNIIDLDKGHVESCDRNYSQKRLLVKPLPQMMEPTDSVEQWSSSPLWSDTCGLQRVPDVVHQDLSPYITTPTTPVDTPDSELHSEAPVFNFDWAGEQHVPNLKIFRNTNHETRKIHDVQPITLHLPKKKNHTELSRDFSK